MSDKHVGGEQETIKETAREMVKETLTLLVLALVIFAPLPLLYQAAGSPVNAGAVLTVMVLFIAWAFTVIAAVRWLEKRHGTE